MKTAPSQALQERFCFTRRVCTALWCESWCGLTRGPLLRAHGRPASGPDRVQPAGDTLRAVPEAGRGRTGAEHERHEDPAPERVAALAIERLGLRALQIALVLALLSALTDTVLAALGGAGAALLLAGAAMAGLALAGALRPQRAAALLRPRGRIVILAVLFGLLDLLGPGTHGSYGDVEMSIGCLAAVLASPGWVAVSVAVLAGGAILDPLLAGHHSLAGALPSASGNTLAGELAGLFACTALTLGAIGALRRTITGAPARLSDEAREPSLTPQLGAAAAGVPAGLLGRADPDALAASLSGAERRVLALLAQGLAPKQAARRLGVKLPTVRSQIAAAKRKTGARTLEQLVGIYAEAGGGG